MSDIDKLIEGYLAMGEDAAREHEAQEWSEGLIGDSFTADPSVTSQSPIPQ